MNKNILGLLYYIIYFFTISYAFLKFFILYFSVIVPITEYLPTDKLGLGVDIVTIIGLFLILVPILYKLFSPFIVSILLIKKCQNPLILKIYNNISTPVKILLSLIALDSVIFLIKGLVTNVWDFSEYIIVYSGTLTFIPILLVAVWNVVMQNRNTKYAELGNNRKLWFDKYL